MKKYKVLFLASSVVVSVALSATSVGKKDVLAAIKEGKEAGCVGVKKVITPKKVKVQKGYKVDIALNESGNYEATELDSSDLGGYSPIPYPCKVIDGFTSEDLNITNEKVFMCHDDTYGATEEVYLLKNCALYGS